MGKTLIKTPLTEGYRLTPMLQIGTDIYCDSRAIRSVLERLIPEATLFPGTASRIIRGLGEWTDGPLFRLIAREVFADTAETAPDEFWNDRGRLCFGAAQDIGECVKHCLKCCPKFELNLVG